MKFFNNFFSNLRSRAYLKFSQNIFFIRHMLSLELQHTLMPHIFLPLKSLKIKFFSTSVISLVFYISYILLLLFLIISFCYFLI